MDIARDELSKKPDEISVEKLQSLLDLALRTSAATADPCHENLTCCVERSTLIKRLSMLKDLEIDRTVCDGSDLEEPVSITGLETFSLSYKVLEPNWHMMHYRLRTAKSIDEVIQYQDFFHEKCLRECLVLLPELLKKVERLKSICLQYAAATQWLISSSIDIPKIGTPSDGSLGMEKLRQLKMRNPPQSIKLATENAQVIDSILYVRLSLVQLSLSHLNYLYRKFEREFNSEFQSLRPILSSGSQAEPYLTHLAQWILSV